MRKAYPGEVCRDVGVVVRELEAPLSQIARDFGISESTPPTWLCKADIDDGVRLCVSTAEIEELRALKGRNRLLEQEHEILRRTAALFARLSWLIWLVREFRSTEGLEDGLLLVGNLASEVSVVPLIAMVAQRSGRSCLMTLRMANPVRVCTCRETVRAVNTIVRCASIASRL